jgi:hypothetical protein
MEILFALIGVILAFFLVGLIGSIIMEVFPPKEYWEMTQEERMIFLWGKNYDKTNTTTISETDDRKYSDYTTRCLNYSRSRESNSGSGGFVGLGEEAGSGTSK